MYNSKSRIIKLIIGIHLMMLNSNVPTQEIFFLCSFKLFPVKVEDVSS